MNRWHREGRTIIAVVHDLELVRKEFPLTLLLSRRPLAWGGTGEALTADNLAMAMSAA
jgi:zinc/manganese transport system ATP-binding protein